MLYLYRFSKKIILSILKAYGILNKNMKF